MTTSPLALAVTSATCGNFQDLQQHLANFAATVSVFKSPSPETVSPTEPTGSLDPASSPVIQNVVAILKAALRSGRCRSLQIIRQSLTSAAWSTIEGGSEQLFQAACEGQQADSFLWLSSEGLQVRPETFPKVGSQCAADSNGSLGLPLRNAVSQDSVNSGFQRRPPGQTTYEQRKGAC